MSALARARRATVIAAGADVSDHPEVYFRHGVQYALLGEADTSLVELLAVLSGRQAGPVEAIAGLAMPSADTIQRTAVRPPERGPDVFPFPAWDLLDAERYRRAWRQAHGYFSVNMVTTRGCPFHCNWCAKPIWGQRYAIRSPANVAEEMAWVKRTLAPDHLWFADDIFGLQPKWVVAFAQEVESRQAAIPFMMQSRVDLMTAPAVAALARAGCAAVWLGVESGSQRILDAMDKGIKVEQVLVVRERLRQAEIKTCFFIQFGYPGETFDDIGISVSYPLPGTKFYTMVQNQLGPKAHWEESNDLAMMFQGTYETPFYRQLHTLLHGELALRQRLQAQPLPNVELLQALERLHEDWFALGQLETQYRSAHPTIIHKDYAQVTAPDLSKGWN
jgi:anaerobic magnesium-protoporphyrin IX monomethyl ester cyclase